MRKIILIVLLFCSAICFADSSALHKKLTVVLDWYPNAAHAPLIVAEQQGYFREQGLNVELITPLHPSDPPKMVADNRADIGITFQPWFMEHVDQGLPLIRIGTLVDKPLICLVALKRSGIKSIADLKGKQVGTSSNDLTKIMLNAMLAKQGVADSDIDMIPVHHNLSEALLENKVNAISGMMRNIEVPLLELNGRKLVVFFPEEEGIPNYSELIFVSNTAHVKDPRFPRFLEAVKKAVAYLDSHPQEAWNQFIQQYPDANTVANRETWFATMPYFAEDPANFDSGEWQRFAEFMEKNKLISKTQPVSSYAVIVR